MNFVINDKCWTLKFDNFPHFQNVTSNNPPPASVITTHCVRKSIFDSPFYPEIWFFSRELAKKSTFQHNQFTIKSVRQLKFINTTWTPTPWTQDVNWTDIRRSEDVLGIQFTFCIQEVGYRFSLLLLLILVKTWNRWFHIKSV